jgi:hypothetical protein
VFDHLLTNLAECKRLQHWVAEVLEALPADVQRDFLDDPSFRIILEEYTPDAGWRMFMEAPTADRRITRCVVLRRRLEEASAEFARFVIGHELAHAFLHNGGWGTITDPEEAANALAASWGFSPPPPEYPTYRGIPPLAGLCSMQQSMLCDWSVEQSASRWKRLHYVLKRVHETLTARITAEPIYELKTAYSHHAYLCAEQVTLIRRRVAEMREPPLGLDKVPHPALERLMDEVIAAPTSAELLTGLYGVVLPAVLDACRRITADAHPLADAPSVRAARLIEFELRDVVNFGEKAQRCLESDLPSSTTDWIARLHACLDAAGGLDGTAKASDTIPEAWHSRTPFQYQSEPKRDERFQDPYNAGVNPEAFLYSSRYAPRDKTLMMYYKRLREIDVPEMMASILVELRHQEPWEFHMEMSRQLWDEARHAIMGEVGFAAQGIDWRTIPINFTWSRNLNLQLDARQRHGVLFFIEQGLMPKTGKRYEWEIATESGDPLSKLFQDFDWADEVLHAQIGRRGYVPRYGSLQEALHYGDACWSKVLSHWREYQDQGLTEHRNWWPQLYEQACRKWGKTPDPAALAFHETYEGQRADLEKIDR